MLCSGLLTYAGQLLRDTFLTCFLHLVLVDIHSQDKTSGGTVLAIVSILVFPALVTAPELLTCKLFPNLKKKAVVTSLF